MQGRVYLCGQRGCDLVDARGDGKEPPDDDSGVRDTLPEQPHRTSGKS